jgi:hypothetical protein
MNWRTHARKGHAEQLFSLIANESTEAKFEREANEQARRWGFPIVSPTQTSKPPQNRVGHRKE